MPRGQRPSDRLRKRYSERRNQLCRGYRRRHSDFTPLGKATVDALTEPLARFIDGELDVLPEPTPGDLGDVVEHISGVELAQMALRPLIHAIRNGWHGYDTPSARMHLCKLVGQHLHDVLVYTRAVEIGFRVKSDVVALPPVLSDGSPLDPEGIVRPDSDHFVKTMLAEMRRRHRRQKGHPPRRRGPKPHSALRKCWYGDWGPMAWVEAGAWLIDCAMTLDAFDIDDRGLAVFSKEWEAELVAISDQQMLRDRFPQNQPAPPWIGWFKIYPDGWRVPLVRGWRPQVRPAIEQAFAETTTTADVELVPSLQDVEPLQDRFVTRFKVESSLFVSQHVVGLDCLRLVPLTINTRIRDLVEQKADAIWAARRDLGDRLKQQRANAAAKSSAFAALFKTEAPRVLASQRLAPVRRAAEVAAMYGEREFYLDYQCDRRGRVYPVSHFAFDREDPVRAMFQFAQGRRLGAAGAGRFGGYTDLDFLEIHAANMFGEDKLPWIGRIEWVNKRRDMIRAVAERPDDTVEIWAKVDKPFSFVAACMELSQAWIDPNFETRLPVQFDGSANGLQHLSLLGRDRNAAALVNLLPADRPQDVYSAVGAHVETLLRTRDDAFALLWRKIFAALDHRARRKFVKDGVMTYPYGVTENGMIGQVGKAYREGFDEKAPSGACKYLAQCIDRAVTVILPGAHEARNYIRSLCADCVARGKYLRWVSPSGFPVINSYQLSDEHDVRTADGGRLVVADGALDETDDDRAIRAAAPNFIHSLDAAHLIKTVLAASASGITDIITIHDCFAVRAGDAARFLAILHRELFLMYMHQDWLGRLRAENDIEGLPPPPFGDLDLEAILGNEYSFS